MQWKRAKTQAFDRNCSVWSQVSLSLNLLPEIHTDEVVFLDLELVLDGIDEERELSPSLRIHVGGALHLPLGEVHTHCGKNLTRFFKANVARLFHATALYSL
jgi:hypothetical protein